MANIQAENKKLKNLVKSLLAVMVLITLWVFFNDTTYNIVKKAFVKNADKYTEMYAYMKSRPSFVEKYFVLQGNDTAKSFFHKEASFTDEDNLDGVKCSKEETILIYEKTNQKISDFVRKKDGEIFTLNQGTDIEFYAAKIKSSAESCEID